MTEPKKLIFQKDGADILEGIELESWGFMAYHVYRVRQIPASGSYVEDKEWLGDLYAGFVEKLAPGVTTREEP